MSTSGRREAGPLRFCTATRYRRTRLKCRLKYRRRGGRFRSSQPNAEYSLRSREPDFSRLDRQELRGGHQLGALELTMNLRGNCEARCIGKGASELGKDREVGMEP